MTLKSDMFFQSLQCDDLDGEEFDLDDYQAALAALQCPGEDLADNAGSEDLADIADSEDLTDNAD